MLVTLFETFPDYCSLCSALYYNYCEGTLVDSSVNDFDISIHIDLCMFYSVAGNISAWKIQRLLTACRFFAYHTPNETTGVCFLEYDKLTSNVLTFMASTKTHIYKPVYDLHLKDTMPNLCVSIHLGYVGSSSLNSVAQLKDAKTGEIYADNVNQVVAVSKETRKPTPLADWWKEKYTSEVIGNDRLIVPILPVHEKHHVHSLKVPWCDIDGYQHTTYTAYIKFCFEAAMDACKQGFYTDIKDDALKYHVELMEIAYKGETKAGDELQVTTWENAENPRKLHFDISRQGSTVFQSSITFHAV